MEALIPIERNKSLVEPDYKEFIKPLAIRRMSKSAKMSIACAFKCLRDTGVEQLDAIIIGTGLGSLADTEKFLKISTTSEQKLLPPTSFIQSGHNTIAGQIALLLKNDCYNMTHVQQGFSFEHALLDSMLNITEGKKLVLAGAVDEHIPLLEDLANRFKMPESIKGQLSEGAGFFSMGPDKSKAMAEVKAISISQNDSLSAAIMSFLDVNQLSSGDIEMGFVGHNLSAETSENLPFATVIYTDYSGRHFSSSAFGLHLASQFLQHYGKLGAHVIIINIAANNKVGLTLLQRV
jgi:3-oxoacyl-[acyl-carrier-protein] synthase II